MALCPLAVAILFLFVQNVHAETNPPSILLVIGAEGEAEYGRAFQIWADRIAAAAQQSSSSLITVGREDADPEKDKDRLKSALDEEAKISNAPLWIILIGHGTFDGREAKFNLRGPDVSDAELAGWLKPIQRPLAVINCSSSSAPFLAKLAAENRIVITATRTGQEINFARFGDHFSRAVADTAADLDKDGQTSLLEAFLAAAHNTAEFYKQNARILTEHALLDDNGDKLGVSADFFQGIRATKGAKDNTPIDGPRAHQWHLVPSREEQALSAEQRARRDELELKIEALRAKRSLYNDTSYYLLLEPLLVELAQIYGEAGAAR